MKVVIGLIDLGREALVLSAMMLKAPPEDL
jgi:hypothetical protein